MTVKFIHVKTNEELFVFADQVSCVMKMPNGYTTLVVPGSAIPVVGTIDEAISKLTKAKAELITAQQSQPPRREEERPNGFPKRKRNNVNKRNT